MESTGWQVEAGWITGPNNEITRQIVGRWALLGAEATDFRNQKVNESRLLNEFDKLDENVWFRPLFSDMTTGSHCEILRVRRGDVPGCHRHPSPVHGYVIEGAGAISSIPGWRARALMSWHAR